MKLPPVRTTWCRAWCLPERRGMDYDVLRCGRTTTATVIPTTTATSGVMRRRHGGGPSRSSWRSGMPAPHRKSWSAAAHRGQPPPTASKRDPALAPPPEPVTGTPADATRRPRAGHGTTAHTAPEVSTLSSGRRRHPPHRSTSRGEERRIGARGGDGQRRGGPPRRAREERLAARRAPREIPAEPVSSGRPAAPARDDSARARPPPRARAIAPRRSAEAAEARPERSWFTRSQRSRGDSRCSVTR